MLTPTPPPPPPPSQTQSGFGVAEDIMRGFITYVNNLHKTYVLEAESSFILNEESIKFKEKTKIEGVQGDFLIRADYFKSEFDTAIKRFIGHFEK